MGAVGRALQIDMGAGGGVQPDALRPRRVERAHRGMRVRWLLAVWRQTEGMTEVRPAANADAARWLLRSDVDWWDLVRYGPPGFDVYVRIAFAQDPMVSTEEKILPFA